MYWILIFPPTSWKSSYLLELPEYAANLDLIGSLFNDFNWDIVGVTGYAFLFPSLLTLKSSA